MGLLDMLTGNSMLNEQTIASDMLKDSKFGIFSLAQALTETANHQLRQLFANHLLTSIQQHHQLSDLVMDKDWYQPYLAPHEQIAEDFRLTRDVSRD